MDELFTTEQYLDASECEEYGLSTPKPVLERTLKRKR